MRRATVPMDKDAVRRANQALAQQNPELATKDGVRPLHPSDPADAQHRKAWMDAYAAAGGGVTEDPKPSKKQQPPADSARAKADAQPPLGGGGAGCSAASSRPVPPPKPAEEKRPDCRFKSLHVTRGGDSLVVDALKIQRMEMVGQDKGAQKDVIFKGVSFTRPVQGPSPQTAKYTLASRAAAICGSHMITSWIHQDGSGRSDPSPQLDATLEMNVALLAAQGVASPFDSCREFFRFHRSGRYSPEQGPVGASTCDKSASCTLLSYPAGEFKFEVNPKELIEFFTGGPKLLKKVRSDLALGGKEPAPDPDAAGFGSKKAFKFEGAVSASAEFTDTPGEPTVSLTRDFTGSISGKYAPDRLEFKGRGVTPTMIPIPYVYYAYVSVSLGPTVNFIWRSRSLASQAGGYNMSPWPSAEGGGSLDVAIGAGGGIIHEKVSRVELEAGGNFVITLKPSTRENPNAEKRDVKVKLDKITVTPRICLLDGLYTKEATFPIFTEYTAKHEGWTLFTIPDSFYDAAETKAAGGGG